MSSTTRKVYRRTDDFTPGTPKIELIEEALPLPLDPTGVLIKVHAVSLNYRDANIANGGNPWPVTPHGILCNDAAGEILAIGDKVRHLRVGDGVAPFVDTKYTSARSTGRSWLAADEDGVLATHIIFDEKLLVKLPEHLDWINACLLPSAGCTAWTALRGVGIGRTVLLQGTGGVSMFALKLARAAGLRIILTSSSDTKLQKIQDSFPDTNIRAVNYSRPNWHEDVLNLTDEIGVDLVLENGGSSSLVKSMKCTRRGGIISQVGYLGKSKPGDLDEFVSTLIDRRIILRGINAGSKDDLDDLCAAVSSTKLRFDDIIDQVFPFDKADEAVEHLWQGKVVGKTVINLNARSVREGSF